ncbi:PilC/PilY family type IV pilus protein [Moraxella lacunata]|uniref:PilC/PilY family type IV pilus protein n=2 Tax=Moraxella lacunata TaxID=477 RepID=UPI0024AD6868|nr:PilC/PilY family type IV pilus protein [Moraxella lacunata]MDI4507644.1 hypothetical protein [Moraxella lacunata]
MKTFSLKKLSHAIALTTAATLPAQAATLPTHANHVEKRIGDLEIYEAATGGGASVLLMLDNSGSMDYRSIKGDYELSYYHNCKHTINPWVQFTYPKTYSKTFFFDIKKDNGTKGERVGFVGYYWPSCGDGKTYHDRMTRVKEAVIALLADPAEKLGADYMKYKIGLGHFYLNTDRTSQFPWSDAGGVIAYPISELTYGNRLALAKKIAELQADTGTPTAHAYAESGAYMLGTKTSDTNQGTYYTLLGYKSGGYYNQSYHQCNNHIESTYQKYTCLNNDTITQRLTNSLMYGLGSNHEISNRSGTFYYHKEVKTRDRTAGSGFYRSAVSTKQNGNYISPVTNSQCDGHGIYFLTDGEPNGGSYHGVAPTTTTTVMNNALTDSMDSVSMHGKACKVTRGASDITSKNATYSTARGNQLGHPQWECIGEFAKALASDRNKVGKPIPTATVGFGKVFESASRYKTDKMVTNVITGEQSVKQVHDCSRIPENSHRDARNLCYLGERGHGYGEGGFYYAESSDDVAKSIADFVTNVSGNISASPAGTVAVPTDPLSITSLQPYAYLPMLQADVAEAPATWPGNLKKYHTINGSLYGNDKTTRLYQKTGGSTLPYATNPKAKDLWQTSASTDGAITTGGTYARLPSPTKLNKNTMRTVYVEDGNQMKKVGVKNGKLEGFDQLSAQYTSVDKAYILHYLGFGSVSTIESTYAGTGDINAKLQDELNKAPTGQPVMGGIHHSVPALVAYKGQFDETGNISSTEGRDDYVLYGSMSGALLMADAKTGVENFSFIPRKMFDNEKQRRALSPSGTGISGEPVFGVDAPWTINAKYNYDFSTQPAKITTEAIKKSGTSSAQTAGHIYAYGGLRMGGKGLYGLDLTDKDKPDMLFSIDEQTPGFDRMGQIWAKPVVAKIKIGTDGKGRSIDREVLIFGGGYDMCYESTLFKLNDGNRANTECANKQVTEGNAVYMVDSETGDLVASWTQGKTINNSNTKTTIDGLTHMKHSVVGGITALDRNNNGYVDHLYFADLGGQLFRIDLIELSGQNHNKKDKKDITNDITRGVVRVFDANGGNMANTHVPYRFYEAPVVSFYTNPDDAQRFAVINLASGDRSSPLSRRRDLGDANRVYGIIDRDIASARVTNAHITADALMSKDLDNSRLQKMDTKEIEARDEAYRETLIKPMRDKKPNAKKEVKVGSSIITLPVYDKMGWYYDMIRYDGRIDVQNLKAVGPGMVTGGVYYNSVYSPDFQYGNAGQCEARTVGATERQMYCMPWGVCPTDAPNKPSKNGTLGYAPAGIGIQELTTVPYTSEADKTTNLRTFLSIQTVQERAEMANKTKTPSHGVGGADGRFVDTAGTVNNGVGADRFSQPQIDREQYNLKVNRWYDFQNVER